MNKEKKPMNEILKMQALLGVAEIDPNIFILNEITIFSVSFYSSENL